MFSLICNVNIQNAQAAAYIVNWWMDVLEKQSNVLWQKMYGANGLGASEPPTSWQMLYHLKFELSRRSRPDAFYVMFLILTVVKRDIRGIYL